MLYNKNLKPFYISLKLFIVAKQDFANLKCNWYFWLFFKNVFDCKEWNKNKTFKENMNWNFTFSFFYYSKTYKWTRNIYLLVIIQRLYILNNRQSIPNVIRYIRLSNFVKQISWDKGLRFLWLFMRCFKTHTVFCDVSTLQNPIL